jgi:hypothetical protein
MLRRNKIMCLATWGMLLVAAFATSAAQDPSGAMAQGTPRPSLRPEDFRVAVQPEAPRLIGVRLRHDLCPLCRRVEPELDAMRDLANAERVLLVDVDLTNEATQRQSAMLLAALGLESVWPKDLRALGTLTVFHARSHEVLASAQATDATQLEACLREAIDSAAEDVEEEGQD